MLGNKHLHIDEDDRLSDWVSKCLQSARKGAIEIVFAGEPAVKIGFENGSVDVNLLRPDTFKVKEDKTGLFDKLKTAAEFGRKLSDSGVTLSFFRRGNEVIRLGKNARPTFSKIITRSNDLQLINLREFAKLKGDLKTD